MVNMIDEKPFQITLAAARVNAGLSQEEAGKRIGVDRTTIVKWESGKVIPRTPYIIAMATIYNVPLEYLRIPEKTTLSSETAGDQT